MNQQERTDLLEEELFILRDSGEIPEIAYHSCLHYLTADPEGPQLTLTAEERIPLQDAALARYEEIVLRDIDPANRDLTIYRGVRRTIYNWQRMQDFCQRIQRDCRRFKENVATDMLLFLNRELADVNSGKRVSSVNCSQDELLEFLTVLDLAPHSLPAGWQILCPEE